MREGCLGGGFMWGDGKEQLEERHMMVTWSAVVVHWP